MRGDQSRILPARSAFDIEAILFDMDGTLVDSSESILETWADFATRVGIELSAVRDILPGRTAQDIVKTILPTASLEQQAVELKWIRQREKTTRAEVRPIAGAVSLLTSLPESRWAVVTAASASMMVTRMKAAGLPLPTHHVTADDDVPGKPSPDPYLRAAKLLGADPQRCAVVEDATAGLHAGRRAGCVTIAVGGGEGPADARVTDLVSVSAIEVPDGSRIRLHIEP